MKMKSPYHDAKGSLRCRKNQQSTKAREGVECLNPINDACLSKNPLNSRENELDLAM